jgi:glycosyltransferase involved in cell wall biosynthesis
MSEMLFLYTEIASYTVSCLQALKAKGTNITLVRYPVNPEAPFQFDLTDIADDYVKDASLDSTRLKELIAQKNPELIYVSGWIEKDYLEAIKGKHNRIPVVMGMDTPWTGTLRQKLGTVYFKLKLKRHFTHAFVAGDPQKTFARKLGFAEKNITDGLYCADTELFSNFYMRYDKTHIPQRFLYVGRYIPQKGIDTLFTAYKTYRQRCTQQGIKPWELICAGTGILYDSRPEIEGLTHVGFVQPEQLGELIEKTGVFVLPSLYEPWGVVVHEYAVAGFPLVCSDKVMAHTRFLNPGRNGYIFAAGDTDALTDKLIEITNLNAETLLNMRKESHYLGLNLTPDIWADKLINIIHVRN